MADVGAATTARVVGELEAEAAGGEIVGGEALSARLAEMLADIAAHGLGPHRRAPDADRDHGRRRQRDRQDDDDRQARLAPAARARPDRSCSAPADTFRAAAVEQLAGWAERAGCEIVRGREGADPGAVAFEAVKQGRERGADVVIIDTAGRLHTQDNLMAELDEGPPRHRQAARRARRTRRC